MNGIARDAIKWEGVRFRYPSAPSDTLAGIDISIREGEFVLLTGPTGCGKSTLLKTINGLIPRESAGRLEGSVSIFGEREETIPSQLLRSWTGFLFQNSDDQLLCSRVQEEVAFGPENLGEDPDLIASRVERALACTGSEEKRYARCEELSGGEKQRVALASILSLGARLLVLDEPTSQLDGEGVELILQTLKEVRERLGVTIIIAEHRLDRILPMADRLIVMDQGLIRGDFRKGRFMEAFPLLKKLGCETPAWMELSAFAGLNGTEGEEAVCKGLKASGLKPGNGRAENHPARGKKEPLLRVRNLSHVYSGAETPALDSISCEVRSGEILALMGHNGSGKTTLLSLLAGLLPPQRGNLERFGRNGPAAVPAGRMGYLFQNPDLMLSTETVAAEVGLGARLLRLEPERAENAISMSMDLLRLENLKSRNPFSLSRGERLRVALGALLAFDPQVLLLDEPTAGLDRGMRIRFLEDLRKWVREKEKARAVVLCTHDTEAALGFADECVILRRGKVAVQGPVDEVLSGEGNGFPPEVAISPTVRIARRLGFSWTPRTTAALLEGISGDE